MKKYSVFVKFSNAMDRGGVGKDDDDVKIDNVICRTPARNAQSLDSVKQEIMDMVEKVVSLMCCFLVPKLTNEGCRICSGNRRHQQTLPSRTHC